MVIIIISLSIVFIFILVYIYIYVSESAMLLLTVIIKNAVFLKSTMLVKYWPLYQSLRLHITTGYGK